MSRERLDHTFNQLTLLDKNYNETDEIVQRQRELLTKGIYDIERLKNDKLDVSSFKDNEAEMFLNMRKLKLRME